MSLHQDVEQIIVGFQDGQRFRFDIEPGSSVTEIRADLGLGRSQEYWATLIDGRTVSIPAHALVALIYRKEATPQGNPLP